MYLYWVERKNGEVQIFISAKLLIVAKKMQEVCNRPIMSTRG